MNRRAFLQSVAGVALAAGDVRAAPAKAGWSAGVAALDITPATSLWMAGYAARKGPSEGVALPLHAKALALRCGRERPVVLVTCDLLGVTARISGRVADDLQKRRGVRRSEIFFNASHTHSGPVVDDQLSVAYDLTREQWDAIRAYTDRLEEMLTAVVLDALAHMRPARIGYARGEAGFAANRRVAFTPHGPADRSVPVLRVDASDGNPLAIVFGYACHNTTLQASFVRYHGDYAGIAQAALERRHPGAKALFVAGCGADANPSPRGTLELVEAHGTSLADAVDRALPSATPVPAALRTSYGVVNLPFVDGAARDQWRAGLKIDDVYLRRYDAVMNAIKGRDGHLPAAQPDPVQVWQFGSGLTLVGLGGEVVVDYALRLAREYPERRMWVAGYSNDVFGYVPSLRVLREGGYEGGDAMVYYARPGPFTESVEELIIGKAAQLIGASA